MKNPSTGKAYLCASKERRLGQPPTKQ
jgi:hypothetical protein